MWTLWRRPCMWWLFAVVGNHIPASTRSSVILNSYAQMTPLILSEHSAGLGYIRTPSFQSFPKAEAQPNAKSGRMVYS